MIKPIIKRIARIVGHNKSNESFVRRISEDPLNASLHLEYALHLVKNNQPYLAFSELKTAEFLGASEDDIQRHKKTIQSSIPQSETMNHNQYFRFHSLANELTARNEKGNYSVLNVGGEMRELASFIPKAQYCLAEPSTNGISGTNLPFDDHTFDYVVSCHVLEHIPVEKRRIFLDQLLSKSKYGIILLNPFHDSEAHVDDRLKLMIEITGAKWAKEHLECTLPKSEEIKEYANENNLQVEIRPNGTLTTTIAFVFIDYFAKKSRLKSDWKKINQFYNMNFDRTLDDAKHPASYMVIPWLSRLK